MVDECNTLLSILHMHVHVSCHERGILYINMPLVKRVKKHAGKKEDSVQEVQKCIGGISLSDNLMWFLVFFFFLY